MNKKKLLIAGGILLVILVICVIVFLVIKNKSNNVTNEVKFDKTVASTITMDVNPSIKVEVNKNNKVINVLALNEDATNNTTTNNNNNNNKPSGGNSLQKCEKITEALNNEEAGKKAASLQGATVGTGSYCDILPPESVLVLSSNGTCAYKVSFEYMTNKCVYYISMETGEVLSSNCTHKNITEGEHQCIIMKDLGVTKREMAYIYDTVDNGNEYTSRVEDVYGTPDADGKTYVYRYHVSKSTGALTKEKMYELK